MLLVIFLVINALFWSLASHSQHCSLIPKGYCVSHSIHLLMGIVFFMLATYIQQREYIDSLFQVTQ